MIDLPEPESDDFSRSTLLEDQRKRWRSGERTPVEAYLQRRPELGENENLVLDLIYNEVLLREELHEAPHADEYVRRFPQHADAIRRLLTLHEELKSHRTTPVITRPDPPGPKQRRRPPPRQLPQIPGYEIVAFIDGGGQGDVYQARHVRLDRPVALKVLRASGEGDGRQLARFHREGRLSARLDHPNIVRIFDYDEYQGYLYFCMEFLEGGSLKERLDDGPLDPNPAATLLATLADAVHYAHERGIIHRDLKPANVLYTRDGVPKIADLGLAKHLDGETTELTDSRAILGTASYMAPEQAAGKSKHVTAATDVYALGAILYSVLTASPPFKSDDWLDILIQVRTRAPEPPSRLRQGVPPRLEHICLKCLEKEPEKRYPSAAALADDLRCFLDGGPDTGPVAIPGSGDGREEGNLPGERDEALALTAPDLAGEDGPKTLPPAAPAWGPSPFPTIPGYEILEVLGRGGMGVVYKARHISLGRPVALKTILNLEVSGARWRRLLRAEALLAGALNHPNIVQVYDLAEHADLLYIAMEFVEGGSLWRVLQGTRPSPRHAAELMEQVARGVGFVHRRGIVHRDLKPANVLMALPHAGPASAPQHVRADQLYGVPKVTDFGLARRVGEGDAWGEDGRDGPAGGGAFVTMAGAIVGTPAYMAPEQARGDLSHVGTASDVWSLGATLYEMLSGHPPFRGDSPWETLEQLLRAEPQPLRQAAPNVPSVLENICLKCLQKDQARRHGDAEELADDLRAFLDGRASTVDRPSFWRRLFSWRRAKAGERPV